MIINNIKLKNFRNIIEANIEFSDSINYIIGNNAQGKTNLVESIYYLSLLKSFRVNKNTDLIMKNKDLLYIKATIDNITNNNIETSLNRKNLKNIKINNKVPEKFQLFNLISCSVFFNDELNYLKFYPSYRRNFIDKSIFYTNNNYLTYLKKYNKCLKQRNSELKKNKFDNIWIDQLIEYGSLIIYERIKYIQRINNILSSNEEESYFIKYQFNNTDNIKDILIEKFSKVKLKEIDYGYTLCGPHTDDFIFTIDNNDFRKFSSEGQKLSFLLNMKYAQLTDFENINGCKPILIFDDIGKELDLNRKTKIFDKFFNKNCQIFITSTNIDCFSENSKTFNVEDGKFFDLSKG